MFRISAFVFPLLLAGVAAQADPPRDAVALDPLMALDCVATRYRGEALRIRDTDRGLVQEIRWRTPSGNVLNIEMTGPGCRFLEVKGVGQSQARILPAPAP